MAIQRRFKVEHSSVFPEGALIKGGVQPVLDFNAERRADGSRPQQVDPESGLLVWQVLVIDPDEEAGKKDTTIAVKFLAKVQPVPPENKTPLPLTPVEFVGLEALPWIDDSGTRPRIAWSFRAKDMVEPGTGKANGAGSKPGGSASDGKAVA